MTPTPEDRWRERQKRFPWLAGLPDKLPPPKPRPVPELGWCARCHRVNPRPGHPEDLDGHDWVEGLDGCAYIAGVICPDCITPAERQKLDVSALELLVHGVTSDMSVFGVATAIFIDPADDEEDPS